MTDAVASGDSAVTGRISGNGFEFRAQRSTRNVAAFRLVGEVGAVGTTAFVRARVAPHPLVRFALLAWSPVLLLLLLATIFVAAWSFREPDAIGSLPLLGLSCIFCGLPLTRVAATADDLWLLSGWFESRFPGAGTGGGNAEP